MSNIDQLEQRVEAVENAVTGGESEFEDVKQMAELTAEVESMATRLEKIERRLAAVEGATESLEGYVGNVRSVNRETEKQADAAVAAVDRLESKLETFERQVSAEAFKSLAQRVEEVHRDQKRLAEEVSNASGATGEFVFGDNRDGEHSENGHSEVAVATNGAAAAESEGPIDPAATDQPSHQRSGQGEQVPPQQQRVDEQYGTPAETELDTETDTEETGEKGTLAKVKAWLLK